MHVCVRAGDAIVDRYASDIGNYVPTGTPGTEAPFLWQVRELLHTNSRTCSIWVHALRFEALTRSPMRSKRSKTS